VAKPPDVPPPKPKPSPITDNIRLMLSAIRAKHAAASSAPFVIENELSALDTLCDQVYDMEQKQK
jgi:hypothetical protein